MALTMTPPPALGTPCPDFELLNIDGKKWSKKQLAETPQARATLVMFICNHCPYVQAIEDRLIALAKKYQPQNVSIIAVSSNDASNYPQDSWDEMKKRATQKGYPFPYLYDEDQSVAHRFGAVCTPDFFLYDREMHLAYRGRLDDSWKDEKLVQHRDLEMAIDALLAGLKPSEEQKPSMGCSIKWKTA